MVTMHKNLQNSIAALSDNNLSDNELIVLNSIIDHFQKTIDSKQNFNDTYNILRQQIYDFVKDELNAPTHQNYDMFSFKNHFEQNKQPLNQQRNSLTQVEQQFARDVMKAIDFIIQNGIGIDKIVNALCHDFQEIYNHGGIDKAIKMCFQPKISGWALYEDYEVGDPDEPED